MELWEKIIVEWINCLKIVTEPVRNTRELRDGTFYINFLELIKWTKHKDDPNGEDVIIRFIEDEYPSFKADKDDSTEHIYIASLLLVHLCHTLSAKHHSLQFSMCDNMKHETQIKVKAFLESILPLGNDVTKETIREVILEVEDTSTTPKHRELTTENCPLSASPITRSGRSKKIMTERIRELRDLRSNLAVERFANADLRDDLTRQQNKVQKLQSKLDEQSAQLKALRTERMKPKTPQPVRVDTSQENYYKRYISDLEDQLNKQQDETTQLETEKDALSKKLSSVQRTCAHYKENFASSERSTEALLSKIESKDRELVELRILNEELRVHMKELNKNSNDEQSFEVDDLMTLSAMKSLNTSEALSSVIEIQLQEAREESAILHAQVDSLKGKLDVLTNDHKAALEVNRDLQERVKILDEVQVKLSDTQKNLDTLNTDVTNLQAEKLSLVARNQDLEGSLSSTKEELSKTKQESTRLNTEIDKLSEDIKTLNESLQSEKANSSNLSTVVAEMKSQVRHHVAHIHELTGERDAYRSSIENCSKNFEHILRRDNQFIQIRTGDFNKLTLDNFAKYFETTLNNCNTMCASYKRDVASLETKLGETKSNLISFQSTAATLDEENKRYRTKLANIEEDVKQKDLLLNEQQEIIHKHSQEIEEIRTEKRALEQNVHELTNNLINQRLLLKSFITQLENLQNVNKDYELMRKEIRQAIIEYRENIKLAFADVQHDHQTLCYNFQKMEREKEDLEHNFNCSKKELSDIQMMNAALQQDLLENGKVINALEEKEKSLHDALNESKRCMQEANHRLEQRYAMMRTEANEKLESLKSENAEISLELKDAVDRFNLLQQELDDALIEMNLKEVQIKELLSDVSCLKAENEQLIHSHGEVLKMKDEEIASKEETSLLLRSKIEKQTNDMNATEKKLKEIIVNLQEVRTSQDAVLATQEAALKEKCIHMDELHEQFDSAKQILNEELENTRLSLREYQEKVFALESEVDNKNEAVIEIAEELKELKAEFAKNKKYCELMDENQAKIVEFCQELKQSAKSLNSTVAKAGSDSDFFDQNLYDISQYGSITDNETANTLNIIKMTHDELQKSQRLILHLSCANTELNKTLAEQRILIENSVKDKKEAGSLKTKVQELEIIAQKRNEYLKNLIKNKESLQERLQRVLASQHDLDTVVTLSKQKWNEILTKFQNIFHCFADSSVCDEFKQFHAKKADLENLLFKFQTDHLENVKSTSGILWEKFLWTEQKLHDTYLCSVHEKECLEILTSAEEDKFSNENMIIDAEIEKYKALRIDVIKSEEEMESLISLLTSYENSIKSGEIKNYADMEKNLQNQITQLTKEGKTLKTKMDTMRLRNVKLEKNIDDLRTEIKELKSAELTLASREADLEELQSLKNELESLTEVNQNLRKEQEESNRTAKQEFDSQLKEVHATYERKLEDMKQKMKTAYNEQMMKLNHTQEKIVREKLQTQMEAMCQKQREELNRYKAHVSDLSSQLWNVGEKLLIEQQQKQEALQRLKELQSKLKKDEVDQPVSIISRKICKTERQEILPENAQATQVTLIKEETLERRHSIRSIQVMGNAFKTEDEEEVFDNVYLADIKRGNWSSTTNVDRLSVLQMRNSLCKPHLKSSYPAEMQFLPPTLTEEEIKSGSPTEENFNDSLSQSLLPEQKVRKKDRSQTSYKKPGPPTPSKNGGRLSLQGNELKSPSSRILRERNMDRRTTTTPHSLKNIFSSKRQDENASSTPKGRRLSNLFRKPRLQPDRSDR
ncbi:hypothetical protein DMN91_004783 [Ooceraea biroi]|uniref:Uncharacterized protein n=2 Tax=Ooceraea biroi TaxID=2015173 RepID=A0A3L8DQ03_OOCBI|nr:myosin-4 isoform X2 [Ooceraea biroi]RLU22505.1 hypothetical protein DMN91_004783 [Ooceraea biroi]